ncbi:hypothetical protein PGQ11_013359 [Apiospora arundinis]|uniref:Uncharacterized protein n=1 Tax=Apiospora arundinis TaxID=335852 RepID=A0ABR2HP10_9PEZI
MRDDERTFPNKQDSQAVCNIPGHASSHGYTDPKNLDKRHKGTKKPKVSNNEAYYAPLYEPGGYYDAHSYGGNGHDGYFKPGAGDYLIADDDTNSTTTTYASQSMYAYYNTINSNNNTMPHEQGTNDLDVSAAAHYGNNESEATTYWSDPCHTNNSKSTAYTSLHGRPIATETEDLDAPRDGRPKLPGDAGLATAYYREARDISPVHDECRGVSMTRYCMGFQPPPPTVVDWGHWAGEEDAPPELGGMVAAATTTTTRWEYCDQQDHDMAKKVELRTRRMDRWADEGLDRHTAPRRRLSEDGRGGGTVEERRGSRRGARRDEEEKKDKRRRGGKK